ncbi:hypothetical protein QUB47_09725 [Microcoleus sp. AT9_B5]
MIGWRIKADVSDNLRAIALHSRKGDRPEKLGVADLGYERLNQQVIETSIHKTSGF